jgi:hypothetical protein
MAEQIPAEDCRRLYVLDVRDGGQFAANHIPGAVNIEWRKVFAERAKLRDFARCSGAGPGSHGRRPGSGETARRGATASARRPVRARTNGSGKPDAKNSNTSTCLGSRVGCQGERRRSTALRPAGAGVTGSCARDPLSAPMALRNRRRWPDVACVGAALQLPSSRLTNFSPAPDLNHGSGAPPAVPCEAALLHRAGTPCKHR